MPPYWIGMSMISVNSSAIAAIGYQNGTLAVQFHSSGTIYTHYGVPYAVFQEFMNAGSLGEYYSRHIRGRYQ
jgi:KTSC domain-containing protein